MMRVFVQTLTLAMTFAALASLATAQVNRRITTSPDTSRARPSATPEPAPQILELRCRGGGLQIRVTSGEMRENDLWMNMTVHFTHAGEGAGVTGQSLAPGQCALPERALLPSEPTEMRAEVINFGQRNRQMHGDPIYKGDQAAEKYPDALNIPPYLSNPNHYWSFFGFNTFDGYFRITNLHYWKPSSAPTSTERLLTANAQEPNVPITKNRADAVIIDRNRKKVATPATEDKVGKIVFEGEALLPPDNVEPLPPNTLRVRIRYREELGFNEDHDTYGDKGPFSCTAFAVRATVLVGLPGTFGVDKPVGDISPNEPMRAGNGLYSCWFTIDNVPFNEVIKVFGMVRDRPRYLSERWRGGSQPQPPPGYVRTVLGSRSVTLTSQQPSALVDMEVVYRPVPTPPR